jgi:hypothetical protein
MFVKAIKVAKNAMFPIFRFEQVDPTQAKIFAAGSGFFVNRSGYFVSVAHVFDNPAPQTAFWYCGQVPDRVTKRPLIIKEVARNDDYDIFIGRVEIDSPYYFPLAKFSPEIGRSVCISGYPFAQIQNNPQGGLELGGVRRYFQPSFILDYIKCGNKNVHGRVRTHDGFLVRDFGLYGMSGGPVFDIRGTVFGIQGSITSPRVSTGGSGQSVTVQNAIAIRSALMVELLKKNKIRHNFLGKF